MCHPITSQVCIVPGSTAFLFTSYNKAKKYRHACPGLLDHLINCTITSRRCCPGVSASILLRQFYNNSIALQLSSTKLSVADVFFITEHWQQNKLSIISITQNLMIKIGKIKKTPYRNYINVDSC